MPSCHHNRRPLLVVPLLVVPLLAAALLLGACAEEPTALRLKMVVDPELNGESQLLSVVQNLSLVLDAPEGFVGAPGEGGELSATDVDRDGKLELVLTKPVVGQKSFPLYRLLPGSNAGRSFYVTARGLVGSQVAAVGGSALAKFAVDQSLELSVPLNLRPAYRAPRVVMSLPHDGQQAVPQALANVYVEFSKWIDERSIEKHLHLIWRSPAGDEREVPGVWNLTNISVNELGFPEERTAATFQRKDECLLTSGEFRIVAEAGITDTSGNALDQDALRPGADPFRSTFEVVGSVVPTGAAKDTACATVTAQPGCKSDPECNPDGGSSFICARLGTAAEGACVLNGQSCGAGCPKGTVCAPTATKGGIDARPSGIQVGSAPPANCVPDCRVYGGCPPLFRCDFGRGICEACVGSGPSSQPIDPSTSTSSPNGFVCYLPCPGAPENCGPSMFCNAAEKRCDSCPPDQKACF